VPYQGSGLLIGYFMILVGFVNSYHFQMVLARSCIETFDTLFMYQSTCSLTGKERRGLRNGAGMILILK
jgi:hypothetical protein